MTLPIVLIEPDEALRGRLQEELIQSGRIVRVFADMRALSGELDPCGVDAVLVPLRDSGSPSGVEAAAVREVACWIRQCATARSQGPIVLGLHDGGASAALQISALHRGAAAVLVTGDTALLREALGAQLRAAGARRADADVGSQGPINGHGGDRQGGVAGQAAGASPGKSSEVREVTLTPRARPAAEALMEPGWIPAPADFAITDEDPIDLKLYERKAVLRAIAAAEGNRTLAAQLLGIGKSTLYRRLSEWRTEEG